MGHEVSGKILDITKNSTPPPFEIHDCKPHESLLSHSQARGALRTELSQDPKNLPTLSQTIHKRLETYAAP